MATRVSIRGTFLSSRVGCLRGNSSVCARFQDSPKAEAFTVTEGTKHWVNFVGVESVNSPTKAATSALVPMLVDQENFKHTLADRLKVRVGILLPNSFPVHSKVHAASRIALRCPRSRRRLMIAAASAAW